jgi:hypothetical protein
MTALVRSGAVLAVLLCGSTALSSAQTENVEADPITCWWRTGAGGVRVGEPFTVALTCSLLETAAVRTIADESVLDASVVQLPPFDVTGGERARDVVTAGRRFIQYQYRLRIVAEDAVGRDVNLPQVQLTYRVESRVPGGAGVESVQGRDLPYVLPPLSVRVLSLVPNTATDIREAPVASFDEIADRAFRGTLLRVSAGIAFLAAALVTAMALLRSARGRREASAASGRVLPDAMVLDSVRRELSAVREESRAGWTSVLAGRALAALRIAAAYTAGRPVSQQSAEPGAAAADGQLAVATDPGRFRVNGRMRGVTLVSGSETAAGLAHGQPSPGLRPASRPSPGLQPAGADDAVLREALARFTAARYGRDGRFDAPRLDESLDDGLRVVEGLAEARRPGLRERLWMR